MDRIRQWTLLTVVAVLAIIAGGYMLLIQPKRDQVTELRASVDAQDAANQALSSEIARLREQAKDLPRQQAKLAAYATRIPSNPALPTLIRALTEASDQAGVELESLAPGAPVAVNAPAPAAPGAAPGAVTAAAPNPVEPLYSIPLTIAVRGGYVQIQQFFSNVEDLTRTTAVRAFTLTPIVSAGTAALTNDLTAAITGQVFMTGALAAAPAPVTAASPTPAAAQ